MEPTESESKEELDRFIEAMETIYDEIIEVAEGKVAVEDSVLRNAPHTVDVVCADEWDRPYSRTQAAFPVPSPARQQVLHAGGSYRRRWR